MAIKRFAITVFSIVFSLGAIAADTTPSESAPSWQADAQKEIKANNYDAAIKTLLAASPESFFATTADLDHSLVLVAVHQCY